MLESSARVQMVHTDLRLVDGCGICPGMVNDGWLLMLDVVMVQVVVVDAALRAIDMLQEVLLMLLGLGEVLLISCRLAIRIGSGGSSGCIGHAPGRCATSSALLARGDDVHARASLMVLVVGRVAHLVRDVVAPSRRRILRELPSDTRCILLLVLVGDCGRGGMVLVVIPLVGVVVGAGYAVIYSDSPHHMAVSCADRHRRGVGMGRPNSALVVAVVVQVVGLLLLLICRRCRGRFTVIAHVFVYLFLF